MRSQKYLFTFEVEGLCGRHHSTPDGENKEVAEMAKKVIKRKLLKTPKIVGH